MGDIVGLEKSSGCTVGSVGSVSLELAHEKKEYLNQNGSFVVGDSTVKSGSWLVVVHDLTHHSYVGLWRIKNGEVTADYEADYHSISVGDGVTVTNDGSATPINTHVYLYEVKGG